MSFTEGFILNLNPGISVQVSFPRDRVTRRDLPPLLRTLSDVLQDGHREERGRWGEIPPRVNYGREGAWVWGPTSVKCSGRGTGGL